MPPLKAFWPYVGVKQMFYIPKLSEDRTKFDRYIYKKNRTAIYFKNDTYVKINQRLLFYPFAS